MAVILDILGSYVVRAAIVVVILNLMINLHQSLSKNTDRITLNGNINSVGEVIAADLKLAGYRASKTFAVAQTNEISFYADLDNSGTPRTIRYYLNPTTPATAHKILYRTINAGTPFEVGRDVITFSLSYYKVNGSLASYGTNITGIKSVYIAIIMESNMTEKTYQGPVSDTLALQAKWERHFFPENL